jgi:signal transduction histidine kinase
VIESGTLGARVPTRQTGDELDELGRLFNSMLDRIAGLIQGMRGALDTVAHELRTPIARIRGTAEVALRSNLRPEAAREALADCVEEADQLLTMLNTLMDISEAETGAMKLDLEPVDLAPLLGTVVDLYQEVADEKRIAVSTQAPEALWLTADRNRVRQVLANLLDNALKYTAAGGRVELRAFAQGETAVVRVKDTGIGMTPEECSRAWDRLYRGNRSRSQRGLGLGLSLVKAVVHAHRGHVEVSSAPGGARRSLSIFRLTPQSLAKPSLLNLSNLSEM